MKNVLEFIVRAIVANPDDVSIEEKTEGDNHHILEIHANQEDLGKIIGKSGRIIHAIRDVIKIIAIKENAFVDVTIAE